MQNGVEAIKNKKETDQKANGRLLPDDDIREGSKKSITSENMRVQPQELRSYKNGNAVMWVQQKCQKRLAAHTDKTHEVKTVLLVLHCGAEQQV